MKKKVIMLLALLPAMVGWSQDTVQSPYFENYHMNGVPNLSGGWGMSYVPQSGDRCGITTKEMFADDSIKVYGVAACMVTERDETEYPQGWSWTEEEWWTDFWSEFSDTTTTECYEYLGIYFASGDSLVPQREVMVHRMYDTAAYYVETGKTWRYSHNFVYPMYEKYFDSAIVVDSTFYVGVTQYSQQNTIGVSVYDHMGFYPLALAGVGINEYHVSKYCWPDEGQVFWIWPVRQERNTEYYLIFPILKPGSTYPGDNPGDTVGGNPGDTVSIMQADLLGRYVSVQPNPAVEEATVLSSFGLERIEAYDAGGQRVADVPATGLQATLDVARWPRGTYLLRVTTPMGTATKKLIVQ